MSDETMLVRLQGGDVVRRKVAYTPEFKFVDGTTISGFPEPETKVGEIVLQKLGDPIPLIIKT